MFKFHEKPLFLFVIVACSYNLAWTAVGSLIRYYSAKYGASFFVYLNVAFYAVGLPVTYAQRNFDTYYDTLLGSADTFLMRVFLLLFISIGLLLCAPITEQMSMIFVAMGVGLCTWFSHGTVTNLSSIAKNGSSTYQQVGFMVPGALCIFLVMAMNLDVDDLSHLTLYRYYGIVSVMIATGVVAWAVLCKSNFISGQLRLKDDQTGAMVLRSEISANGLWEYPEIRNLMRRIINASASVRRDADAALGSIDGVSTDTAMLRRKYPVSLTSTSDMGVAADLDPVENPLCSTEMTISVDHSAGSGDVSRSGNSNAIGGQGLGSQDSERSDVPRTTFTDYSQLRISDLMDHPAVQGEVQRILEENSASIVKQAREHVENTREVVYRTRWALFVTIFCSILQGSFLAYVESSNSWSIGTVLFFVRNFSDLSGRIVALVVPVPLAFRDANIILALAVMRALIMVIFFVYIAVPPGAFFLNNIFIVIYQVCRRVQRTTSHRH